MVKGSRGAAEVTIGDEGHVMLLQDEAHLSASSKISTMLAHLFIVPKSCSSSHILMTIRIGVSVLDSFSYSQTCTCIVFKGGDFFFFFFFKAAPSVIFVQSRAPSGDAGKKRKALHSHQLRRQRCALFAQI